MSIHSGGGGVDVGTWNESDDFSCQDSIPIPDSEGLGDDTREAEAMSMARQPTTNHRARPQMVPAAMDRETLSEPDILNVAVSPQIAGLEPNDPAQDSSLPPVPTTEAHRPQAPHISSSPQLPSQRHSGHRGLARRSSTSIYPGISHTVSQPQPQSTHSPPLGSVSSLGTGFQIGLSPLSPGFTIVPLDRRRRISGRASLADVANDIITDLREAERRTVSEGGLTGRLLNEVQDDSRDNGAATRENHVEGIGEGELEARRRWRWIRKVFTGKN